MYINFKIKSFNLDVLLLILSSSTAVAGQQKTGHEEDVVLSNVFTLKLASLKLHETFFASLICYFHNTGN